MTTDQAPTHNLERFITAQSSTYDKAVAELMAGRKTSHWMWFIFPQLRDLGRSDIARYYGIKGRDEAKAYVDDPVLRDRLLQCCEVLLHLNNQSIRAVMGTPDDLKLRSCVTLFREVCPDELAFQRVLDRYYDGQPDQMTLELLEKEG